MPNVTLDILRTNQREQRGSAELFARLLERHAEGHALFHPREVGAIADCGYIENGMFTKLFNACDPPSGIDQFGSLQGLCEEDLRDNSRHLLQSSKTRTVSFKASITDSCLPADTHPVEITPEITRSSDDFAFLAFAGSARILETMNIPARTRLWAWFIHNSVRILDMHSMPAMQLIYKTVKSAGWVGGVAHRQSTTTAGRITGRLSHFLRANVSLENSSGIDTGMIDTRGPPRGTTWSHDAPRSYTVVVKCFQITRTDKWLYKLGLRVPAAAHALLEGQIQGQTGVYPVGTTAGPPNASEASEQRAGSIAHGDFAGTDDLGPDHTVLSEIMERAGRDVQDDEVVVVASSEIIHAYMKDYEADPEPTTVRYDVERLPIANGMYAIHVVRLYLPDRVANIPGTAADIMLNVEAERVLAHPRRSPAQRKAQWDAMKMERSTLKTDIERQATEINRLRANVAWLSGVGTACANAPEEAESRESSTLVGSYYGSRGAPLDGSNSSSTDVDELASVNDSDGDAGGVPRPSLTGTEKKLAISDDAISSSRTAETEHDAQCTCDWARYLPPAVGLSREEHDGALALYFAYGAGWGQRVVQHMFMRDMRAALSTPPGLPLPPTAHWSPALHCAMLADAAAYAPAGSALRAGAPTLAVASRDYAEDECTSESGVVAAVQALAVLARYHLGFPKGARLAYGRFGMAVRVALDAGLNMDCAEWVRLGRIDKQEKWDRDWCFYTLLVQDVEMSLQVGLDISVPEPPSSLRPPQLVPITAPTDGGEHDVFLATVSLMRLAARMMKVLQVPYPEASEVSGLQSALAQWDADLPDALRWNRTKSTNALPHVIVLHMEHWWITILLHRPFYLGHAALDESVKFTDDAVSKILRAISAYEQLYTLAHVPLSVTQMAWAAGAAALLRAAAAPLDATKKPRKALEACTAAVNALRAMSAAWPCAAGYADALENRMALVGRPGAIHSLSPLYAPTFSVVHDNDEGGRASQVTYMFNRFGGPGGFADGGHIPSIPSSLAAQMEADVDAGAGDAGGIGLGLKPGDASGTMLRLESMTDMHNADPTANPDSSASTGYAMFQSSRTQQKDGVVSALQNYADPTGVSAQQEDLVFHHSASPSRDSMQTHTPTGSQDGGQQAFGGAAVGGDWP